MSPEPPESNSPTDCTIIVMGARGKMASVPVLNLGGDSAEPSLEPTTTQKGHNACY